MLMNNEKEINLKEIILNTKKPIVFRKFKHNWKCFEGTLENWCKKVDEASTELNIFERMPLRHWNSPQWERDRTQIKMSCTDFLKHTTEGCNFWLGLNYKRLVEIPTVCRDGVDFSCFGFPEVGEDATFWLSSKCANTPCHYDTYGCNIVTQVYGRKSWLLFPQGVKLSMSRIPYEESSVYCLENFYSPNSKAMESFSSLDEFVYHCVLEPNDVLIVPRGWWHYVESLEASLSINAWVPLDCDLEAKIEECIVKFLMEHFAIDGTELTKSYMLNPNQLNEISPDAEMFAVLRYLIEARKSQKLSSKETNKIFSYQYLDEAHVVEKLRNFPTAYFVKLIKSVDYHEMLQNNSNRFDESLEKTRTKPICDIKETLINSICCPDVVLLIKQLFIEKIEKIEREKVKLK